MLVPPPLLFAPNISTNWCLFDDPTATSLQLQPEDDSLQRLLHTTAGSACTFQSHPSLLQYPDFSPFTPIGGGDLSVVKKLSHNASERDRRKKLNTLYSSLRSLLPATDQTRKLSIPATVSRVLKYIPELQHQIQRLTQEKEHLLLSRINNSRQQEKEHDQELAATAITTTTQQHVRKFEESQSKKLEELAFQFQISKQKLFPEHHQPLFSEILNSVEKDGYLLINASSFESGDRAFYTVHIQGGTNKHGSGAELS